MVDHGAPAEAADLLIGLFAAARHGDFAATDPTLQRLLGRSPAPIRDTLAAEVQVAA